MNPLEDASRLARDAAYVAVGFGVLGFVRLQVRRQEVNRWLKRTVGDTSAGRLAGLSSRPAPSRR